MVTYSYTVSAGGPLTSIQQAINAIVTDLSTSPTVTQDIIVTVGNGSYSGFSIPNGSLLPLLGSTYRVIIKSAGDFFPIIDFNQSDSNQIIGADLGAGNPNVTLERLRFQYFAVGIRGSINSHNPKINKCLVTNNRNAGIFIEQCENTQILQSIVTNGDYGIVVRLSKNIALIHNTVFLNGSIATEIGYPKSAIWCELANDYGGGTTDSGVLHLIGNIAWSMSGTSLTVFQNDLERTGSIVSNFNDWVIGDRNKFIVAEDRTFYSGPGSSPRTVYRDITTWKQQGIDANSKSEDPRFIVPVRIQSGRLRHNIDLTLLPLSPILGLVPSFYIDTAATSTWLPSYVDSADLDRDVLNKQRQRTGTAMGANDGMSNAGFFGQDVFTSPLDGSIDKNCDLIPLSDVILKKYELWYPTYNIGYFYSYEREYYLYAKKRCSTLGELAATKFYLPSRIASNKPVSLVVNGLAIDDTRYLDLRGDHFILYHLDLPINHGDEEVELTAYVPVWGSGGFTYTQTSFRFKIKEGETQFLLPQDYVQRGPVVITDDASYPTDDDLITNREYSISWNQAEQRAEIKFALDTNLVGNAQFDYALSGSPLLWHSRNATVTGMSNPIYSVAGPAVCRVSGYGFIEQLLPAYSGSTCLTFHAYSPTNSSVGYNLHYYDYFNRDLGYVITGVVTPTSGWARYQISLGPTGSVGDLPTSSTPLIQAGSYPVPDNPYTVAVRLENRVSNGIVYFDAIQYEMQEHPSVFHRKPFLNELTVEYETSDSTVHTDTHQVLSPTLNLINDGFLYIPEILASVYNGPDDKTTTTLHEWKWPAGRKYILPWARTHGKDKLRKRADGRFHSTPGIKPEMIAPVGATAQADSIEITPARPTVIANDTIGIGVAMIAKDVNGNPMANSAFSISIIDYNGYFPGWLSKRQYGLKEQLGQTIYGHLTNAGSASFQWIPPDNIHIRSSTPPSIYGGVGGHTLSYLDTRYPVNLEYNGNVTVQTREGTFLPVRGTDPIRGNYVPTYAIQSSQVKVDYPIVPGSLLVIADGLKLSEVFINVPDSDQYFVDYESSTIYLKGRVQNIYIEYLPSFAFVSNKNPYRIMFYHDKVFGTYADQIIVGYDCTVTLATAIHDISSNNERTFYKNFDMVVRNPMAIETTVDNQASLEIL